MCDFGISREPRGAALVIVMLVMAVLLLAGTTFLTISSTENQIALNEQGSAAAHVLAEAVIHKALAFYYADPNSTYAGETNTALGGGTFSVSVTTVAGCTATSARKVVATGSVPVRGGTGQAQIEVTLDQVSYPYQWAAFAAVSNQIIGWLWDPLANIWWDRTNSELLLRDTTLVDSFDSGIGPYDQTANSGLHGNVGANGDVEIDYNSTVDGEVQAGAGIFPSSGVTVTGTETSNLSPNSTDAGVPFPTVTPGVTPMGALTVPANGTVTLTAGKYYYTNIKMGDNAKLLTTGGPVTIYVTGPPVDWTSRLADLGMNVTMGAQPGTQLQIIAKSDPSLVTRSDGSQVDYLQFVAQDGFRLYGSLYGKNTDIYLGYNSQVYGSIIGRTVQARSGSNIHFDQAMSNRELCHNGKYTIRRGTWREMIPSAS
jgi:Tfp pilus assembly protein PilX